MKSTILSMTTRTKVYGFIRNYDLELPYANLIRILNHIQCYSWTKYNVKCLYIYSLDIKLNSYLNLSHKLDFRR